MVLPSTPRSVMLSQAHPSGGRESGMLSEGVCGLPRRAEGERRNASWVPSMVRRRGPAACGGMDVSLCRRLDGITAYGVVCRERCPGLDGSGALDVESIASAGTVGGWLMRWQTGRNGSSCGVSVGWVLKRARASASSSSSRARGTSSDAQAEYADR